MNKLIGLILIIFIVGCNNKTLFNKQVKLQKKLNETSGIASLANNSIWFVEDSGNSNEIYKVDSLGKITRTVKIKKAKNIDWEDLTTDENDNIFIGDFGNNENTRRDLVIYKISNPEKESGNKIDAEKIRFSYPEQTQFPPKNSKMVYDSEAFFYKDSSLFIITKSREIPFTGQTLIYKIPAKKGNYKAELVGSFFTCLDDKTCKITAAAISPNKKKVVLLSNGKLWVFTNFTSDDFTDGTMKIIDLKIRTQLESVCFKDSTTLLLSDEEKKKTGRNLYWYTLN